MRHTLKIMIVSFIIISIANCSNQGNSENEVMKLSSEETFSGDSIRILLNKINLDSNFDASFYKRLLKHFKNDEEQNKNSFFTNEKNIKLFYSKMIVLKEKSHKDKNALRFLIELSFIIKRSVEINEFLAKLTPKLALLFCLRTFWNFGLDLAL
jgi:hypothetical protein